MVQSTKHRPHFDAPGALDVPPNGRIFAQRSMRAHRVVILHVTFEDMAQMLLACHHDVVQAFPADRADQALRIPVLPRRACRRRMIANAERANATNE